MDATTETTTFTTSRDPLGTWTVLAEGPSARWQVARVDDEATATTLAERLTALYAELGVTA